MRTTTAAMFLAGAFLATAGPAAGSVEEPLEVFDASVTFSPGGQGGTAGTVRLRGTLLSPEGFMAFDPRLMQAGVRLGPAVLSGEVEEGAVTLVRERGYGNWTFRTLGAYGGRGRMELRVNLLSGRFRWKARGVPAGDLLQAGPAGVIASMRLGEAAWSGAVDFREAGSRKWTLLRPLADRPPPGGAGGGGGLPAPTESFTTVAAGSSSGISSFTFGVAADQAAWDVLWSRHAEAGPAPAVDFSREMAVGVWLGSRPTGGYSVTITSAVISRVPGMPDAGTGVAVEAREDVPGPSCIVTQAETRPFHVVRMARAVDGSTITLTRNVVDCPRQGAPSLTGGRP